MVSQKYDVSTLYTGEHNHADEVTANRLFCTREAGSSRGLRPLLKAPART